MCQAAVCGVCGDSDPRSNILESLCDCTCQLLAQDQTGSRHVPVVPGCHWLYFKKVLIPHWMIMDTIFPWTYYSFTSWIPLLFMIGESPELAQALVSGIK